MIVTDLKAFDYNQNAEAIKLLTYLNERRYKKDLFENSKNLRLGIDTDFTSVFLITRVVLLGGLKTPFN